MRKFHLSIPRDISISAHSRDQARGSPSAPANGRKNRNCRNSNINTRNSKLDNQLLRLRNFVRRAQCEFRVPALSSSGSSAIPAVSPTRS